MRLKCTAIIELGEMKERASMTAWYVERESERSLKVYQKQYKPMSN